MTDSKTSTFYFVDSICKLALKDSLIVGLLGEPGFGKTTYLQDISQKNPDIYFLSLGKSYKPINFYSNILHLLENAEPEPHLTLYKIMRRCVDSINSKPRRILLILDEGGKINSASMLEFVHELRTQTLTKLGIVIAAPPYLKLTLEKWIRANKNGVHEFYRRINTWKEIPSPTINDLEMMASSLESDIEVASLAVKGARSYSDVKNNLITYRIQRDMKLEQVV